MKPLTGRLLVRTEMQQVLLVLEMRQTMMVCLACLAEMAQLRSANMADVIPSQ